MRSLMKMAEMRQTQELSSQLANALCAMPTARRRVSVKVARYFLLSHPTLMAHGRLYETHTKSIGAGVYEVFLKLKNP